MLSKLLLYYCAGFATLFTLPVMILLSVPVSAIKIYPGNYLSQWVSGTWLCSVVLWFCLNRCASDKHNSTCITPVLHLYCVHCCDVAVYSCNWLRVRIVFTVCTWRSPVLHLYYTCIVCIAVRRCSVFVQWTVNTHCVHRLHLYYTRIVCIAVRRCNVFVQWTEYALCSLFAPGDHLYYTYIVCIAVWRCSVFVQWTVNTHCVHCLHLEIVTWLLAPR